MENRTLEELNTFAESLYVKIDEIKDSLSSSYTTKADLKLQSSNIFNQLSKSISTKINEIFTDVSEKYETNDFTASVKDAVLSVVYTRDEIDGKKYLTEHQSLENYVTKDYLKDTYINRYDIHGLIKCNCLKPTDLTTALQNYVSFKVLPSFLDKYYIKTDIDNKIDDVRNRIPSLDTLATKDYVTNVKTNLVNSINKTYLSIDSASETYLSLLEHNSYTDYVDKTYLKKSDFDALGVIDSDTIKNYATKSDLKDYALNSTVSILTNNIRNANSKIVKIGQNVNSISTSLNKNYMKTSDLLKSFYTKSDADELFLTKDDASETYLTKTKATTSYLTKSEAAHTYLAIEDYKKSIIGGGGSSGDHECIDAYTKTEITDFDFASKEWVKNNFKCKEWIITNDY